MSTATAPCPRRPIRLLSHPALARPTAATLPPSPPLSPADVYAAEYSRSVEEQRHPVFRPPSPPACHDDRFEPMLSAAMAAATRSLAQAAAAATAHLPAMHPARVVAARRIVLVQRHLDAPRPRVAMVPPVPPRPVPRDAYFAWS
ncbi:hypothetical protein GGF31_000283 [Allomyces arbusculus]|nr:hypothetical protein GGF31_000283 [Allomyces arbusculus]